MTPTIKTSEAITFAGRNGTFAIGPSTGIKDLWIKLMDDFGKIEGQVGFKAYGVCHAFDGSLKTGGYMDYMAAVQVSNAGNVPGYLHTLIIPARKVAVFKHHGKIETLPQTWAKIFDTWLPKAKLTVADGPQFEVYSEDFDGDAGTGTIEIHIPVK
jgi:AraC family transcriptional regulator